MLTRSAARAKQFVIFFLLCSEDAQRWVFTRTAIHNKLPEDVLLEIFNAYRHDMELQPRYENTWNRKYGWFKLAQVCLRWRRVVISSPSRLDMHLLVTPRQSSMDLESMMRCFPRLPILLDYGAVCQPLTTKENNLALVALEDRGRVRGIALRTSNFGLLSQPFPELKSLEICHDSNFDFFLISHANVFSTLAPSLRRLTFQGVTLGPLPQLLSSATGLVELALTSKVGPWSFNFNLTNSEDLLLGNLKRMSCLRCLKLKLLSHDTSDTSPPLLASALAGDIIPLLKLTDFVFRGPCSFFHILIVRLAAPSLQHLDAEICGESPRHSSTPPLIPPLCKFICDTKTQFITVRLGLSQQNLEFSAETIPKSDHAPSRPFRIFFPKPVAPLKQLGDKLSGPLSTVEEVVVVWGADRSTTEHSIQWRAFFRHLRRVKMVQLPSEEALNVAASFQKRGLLDLLPALGHIKVHSTGYHRNDKYKCIRNAFKPLIAARQQVGRPMKLSRV